MERNVRLSRTPFAALLENLRNRLFTHQPARDPDRDQLFSDAIEREMLYRELHGR